MEQDCTQGKHGAICTVHGRKAGIGGQNKDMEFSSSGHQEKQDWIGLGRGDMGDNRAVEVRENTTPHMDRYK